MVSVGTGLVHNGTILRLFEKLFYALISTKMVKHEICLFTWASAISGI